MGNINLKHFTQQILIVVCEWPQVNKPNWTENWPKAASSSRLFSGPMNVQDKHETNWIENKVVHILLTKQKDHK